MATTSSAATRFMALAAVLTCLLCLPNAAQAQSAEDALRFAGRAPATNARTMGMAGAGGFTGIADYSALLNNPAGLGYFSHSMLAGALQTLSARDQSTATVGNNTGGTDNSIRQTGLQNLAYVYKFPTARGSLVIGGAYNQTNTFERELLYTLNNDVNSITDAFVPSDDEYTVQLDENGDYVIDFTPAVRPVTEAAWYTYAVDFAPDLYEQGDPFPFLPAVRAGTLPQNERVTEGGRMNEVNLGGSWEAAPGLMVGLSGNLSFGTYRFDRDFKEDDVANANTGNLNSGTTDFNYLTLTQGFESDLIGANLRLGVSTNLSKSLRAGIALETPTYYQINEDYHMLLETAFDTPDVNGDKLYTYGNLDDDLGNGSFEYQLLTPWRFGGGVALNTSNLLVSADLEFVDWTQTRLRASSAPGVFDQENLRLRHEFNAVVNTRIGAEYWLGKVALRAGYAHQPDPKKSDEVSQVDRSRDYFSAGLGYRFSPQAEINFAWMQQQFDDQYSPYNLSESYQQVAGVAPAPVVNEGISRNCFSLGLRFYF